MTTMAMMMMAMTMVMMMMLIIMMRMMMMTTADDMSRCGNESYSGVREVENGDPEESRRMIDSRIGALHSEVTMNVIVFIDNGLPVSDCHVIINPTQW